MKRAIALLLILPCVFGCGQKDQSAVVAPKGSEKPLSTGGEKISASDFSFEAPVGWKSQNVSSSELERGGQNLESGAKTDTMNDAAKKMAQAGNFKLFVFGKEENGFRQNINVAQVPLQKEMSPEDLKAEIKQEMSAISSGVEPEVIDLPAGKCVKFLVPVTIKTKSGEEISSLGYAFARGKSMTTVTFTCLAKDTKEIQDAADKVMPTFQFKS